MIKEAIGGFFYGLFIGFILAIAFGLPASLFSSNYIIANLFSFLASVSIIVCPIWGMVKGLKSGKQMTSHKKSCKGIYQIGWVQYEKGLMLIHMKAWIIITAHATI